MHDFRFTCASWLVLAGRPILEVRGMPGHASVTMTERYTHLAPDKLKDATRALES
jgi:integrase